MKRVIFSFYIDIPKEELDIFDKELPIVKNKKALPINLVTKDRLKNMKEGQNVCFGLRINRIDNNTSKEIENLTLKMPGDDEETNHDHIDLYMGDTVEVIVEVPNLPKPYDQKLMPKFKNIESMDGIIDANKFKTSGIFYIAPY